VHLYFPLFFLGQSVIVVSHTLTLPSDSLKGELLPTSVIVRYRHFTLSKSLTESITPLQ